MTATFAKSGTLNDEQLKSWQMCKGSYAVPVTPTRRKTRGNCPDCHEPCARCGWPEDEHPATNRAMVWAQEHGITEKNWEPDA